MPLSVPLTRDLPVSTVKRKPVPDLGVPNYDRTKDRGNYLVVSLRSDTIEFSSYCPSFSRALAMTRLSKMQPTWILSGLEKELVDFKKVCAMRADWLTPKIVDNLIRSFLGESMKVVSTTNV